MVKLTRLLALTVMLLLPFSAHADDTNPYKGIDEASIGQDDSGTKFSCSGGTATGRLFSHGMCPDDIDIAALQSAATAATPSTSTGSKLLVYFICNFEETLNEVFTKLYCAMQKDLFEPLGMVLILYVTLFGVVILTGMVALDGRSAFTHLMKLALVYGFATNASLAIGIAYTFFMKFAGESIGIVLSALTPQTPDSPTTVTTTMDRLGNLLDQSLLGFIGEKDKSTVGLLMALMILLFPVGIPIAYNIVQLLGMIARAVLGYLLAITGITFLMTLAPIFLSFALFKHTQMLFDKWLQYLMSFALQVMVVFAAIVLWIGIDQSYKDLYQNISNVYCSYKVVLMPSPMRIEINLPSVCEYTIKDHTTDTPPKPPEITKSSDTALSPLALLQHNDLISTLGVKALALILLSYVINGFMEMAPEIAKALAGQLYAVRLGGAAPSTLAQPGVDFNMPAGEALGAAQKNMMKNYFSTPGSVADKARAALFSSYQTVMDGAPGAAGKSATPGLLDSIVDDLTSTGIDDSMMSPSNFGNPSQQNQYYFSRPTVSTPPTRRGEN